MPGSGSPASVESAWTLAAERSAAKLEKVHEGQVKLEGAIDALRRSVDLVVRAVQNGQHHFSVHEAGLDNIMGKEDKDAALEMQRVITEPVGRSSGALWISQSSPRSRALPSLGSPHGDVEGTPCFFTENSVGGANHMLSRSRQVSTAMPHAHFVHGAAMMRSNLTAVVRDWTQWTSENVHQKKHTSVLMSNTKMSSTIDRWLPLHPMAILPTAFDCLSTLVLVADALIIPVVVAWDLRSEGWLRYLGIIMVTFWACDIVLKFCTGYIDGASVVQSWSLVAKRYLRRTFMFDIALVFVDIFEIVYSMTRSTSTSGGALTMTRFVRFAKLTRMARIGSRMHSGTGGVTSRLSLTIGRRIVKYCGGAFSSVLQYANLVAILMKLACVLLGVGHLLSCAWYYMLRNAAYDGDADEGWLGALPPLNDKEIYLYGIYWSLSTMFAGGSFLPPVLPWEIVFSALLILLGVLLVTGVTSSLAVTLIEAQQAWADSKKKLANLILFMERAGLSSVIVMIVRENYIANVTSSAKNMTEANVQDSLVALSRDMQALLRDQQYAASFQRVHVFRLVQVLHPRTVQELCLGASFRLVRNGNDLFETNQDMANVTLLAKGQAVYTQWVTQMHSSSLTWSSDVVSSGAWLCEVALLFVWKTMGTLEAKTNCETLSLSVDSFTKAVTKLPPALAVLSSYCEHFHEAIRESGGDTDITDIHIGMDTDLVVAKMPKIVRRDLVSAPLLDRLQHGKISLLGLFRGKAMPDLEREIRVGKCYLTTTEQGDILRVVRMIVLDLRDEDGKVCVQLAHSREGQRHGNYSVDIGLPGQKYQEEETPNAVVARLLENSFAGLIDKIDMHETDERPVIEHVSSKSFGIRTKYIKIVVRATLRGKVIDMKSRVRRVGSLSTPLPQLSVSPAAVVAATSAAVMMRAQEQRSMICAWVEENEFNEMRGRIREVEYVVRGWLCQMTAQDLDGLTQWRFHDGGGGGEEEPNSPYAEASYSLMSAGTEDLNDVSHALSKLQKPVAPSRSANASKPARRMILHEM